MRLCFIVERVYRQDGMPLRVAEQLLDWGHEVDLLEPDATVAGLGEPAGRPYDAWVLKTVSEGPGLSLLEAAAATGVATINDVRAIRRVRDKAVAAAWARVHGLPSPTTWFVTHRRLLEQIPQSEYPLVVKPANGSRSESIAERRCCPCRPRRERYERRYAFSSVLERIRRHRPAASPVLPDRFVT